MPEETNTDYTKADKTDRKVNQTYIIADKQKGEIEALISTTTTLEDKVGNMYSKEEVNQLLMDAETGLTNIFSKSGGNNIFRNTGLWFENGGTDSQQNPYEFWIGNVARIQEERASNIHAMSLQSGTLEQEQEVKNDIYNVSFKYIKNILLANVKVIINDVEYILDSTSAEEIKEFSQTIEVSAKHINIKFVTDVNNSCEIFDLMVNVGDTSLVYTQNENETTTDTVNISKGITITSSDDENVKFKADYYGIRTLDKNENEITKFTNKGMITEEAEIKGKSKIVKLLYQEVSDQTWITRL